MTKAPAFIAGPDGQGMTDLGEAQDVGDINEAGQVVGRSGDYAFFTGANGVGMTYLGTLGGRYSFAHGINDTGQVVGYSHTSAGDIHAFVTGPDGKGMVDLNLLVDLPDRVLTEALDINNRGQIIAIGIVPEPKSYLMLLAGLSLVGFMPRRKKMVAPGI